MSARRNSAIRIVAAVCVLVMVAIPVSMAAGSAGGDLDPSFGSGGVVLTPDPGRLGIEALAVAGDGRGRAVVAGASVGDEFTLFRYRRDGSLDPSFGSDGQAERPLNGGGVAYAVAVQPDGKIVLAGGEDELLLGRYQPDGLLDRQFGHEGVVDGRITVGTLGAGFLSLGLQKSGRIVAAGYGINPLNRSIGLLVGYRPDGRLDTRFGDGGFVRFGGSGTSGELDNLIVLPSGKMLLAGRFGSDLLLARCLPDGSPDPGFGGGDGKVLIGAPASVAGLALAPGGRPLLAVNSWRPKEGALVARFRPNGKLDRSFGHDGVVRATHPNLEVAAVTVLRGGGIALSGSAGTSAPQVAVLRFLPDGRPDRGFGKGGFFARRLGLESVATAALAEPDGGLLVVGRANRHPVGFEVEGAINRADFALLRLR
jgi:uncharacterized delta-60 repeat protein